METDEDSGEARTEVSSVADLGEDQWSSSVSLEESAGGHQQQVDL